MISFCGMPEFYDETFPKARKSYPCVECSAPIENGEKHLRYAGKWDGNVSGGRQHMLCREACMFIRDKFHDGDCIGFGELREYLSDYTGDRKSHEFRSIIAKIKWRERRFRTFRKKDRTNGALLNRKWGQTWEVIPEARC